MRAAVLGLAGSYSEAAEAYFGYATIFVTDTTVLNNGSVGIYIGGDYRIEGTTQRVTVKQNNYGLYIVGTSNAPKRLQIGDGVLSYDGYESFHVEGEEGAPSTSWYPIH